MWWSDPASSGATPTRRSGDHVPDLLARQDLTPSAGLWCDAGRTVGVARSPAGLFVGWLDVGWTGPDEPFAEMRDVAHLPDRVGPDQLAFDLEIALAEARRSRREHLRSCARCDEQFVPGQMYGAACCHSCAVRAGETRA